MGVRDGDERPAAPPPAPPGAPQPPPPPVDGPPDELDDWEEDLGELPDDLFDREWPDDEDDDAQPPVEEPASVEPTFAVDDEPEDDVGLLEDRSVDVDLLEDLAAADDTDIPVIDPELMVKLDGRTLPARVDWARVQTVWVRPAGPGPERDLLLEVSGRRLTVRVAILAGDQEVVLLGRDLLKGRFLLRA